MKTKRISFATAICLGLAIAVMLLKQNHLPVSKKETPPNATTNNVSNSAPSVTNAVAVAKKKTDADHEEDYFKTITDPQTGEYIVANSNRLSVVLKDKNGKMIWSTNVAGWVTLPGETLEENTIWSIQLITNETGFNERFNDTVGVRVGKGIVFVNIKTGDVKPGPIY